ncbi:ABC transporter ATP-binding protein [Candidatus Gracilibacteria bacterium]|nr:ABC transporter ATP-binding protein [Candidatus Gracilibacteria bacterium]
MIQYFQIKNLCKYFGGLHAVDNLCFSVKKNSITGLIGPNGAGKTTAFNLISHFLPRDKGDILFQNENLKKLPAYILVRKGIIRTFQQIRLFPNLTIRENLLLALSKNYDGWWTSFFPINEAKKNEEIEISLQKFDLEKLIDEKAEDLSYGQSRIIEILQKKLTGADFILLDEPASGINPTRLLEIEKLLLELKSNGKTILIIEHNMNFIMKMCDEIIVMENGKVLLQDTPQAVQKNQKVLEAYLGKNNK